VGGYAVAVDAVCRNLEIIGEAATKLELTFKSGHPEVAWRSIIDTRNFLIHAYDQVNPVVLSGIVEHDIPNLLAAMRRMLDAPRSS
jgi:uncharacterized protein with HEPN domain